MYVQILKRSTLASMIYMDASTGWRLRKIFDLEAVLKGPELRTIGMEAIIGQLESFRKT